MKVETTDAAMIVPATRERDLWGAWHWFWAKIFGERMPTSGERAHVGNLLITYGRGGSIEDFVSGKLGTDARRIHKIGELWIYDYGETPIETYESPFKAYDPRPSSHDEKALLADNKRTYPQPHRSSA